MIDVNKVILIGRLGQDPVQRTTKKGQAVTNFSIATSRKLRPVGEDGEVEGRRWEEETQWHSIVAWGRQAEYCSEYLKKGHAIFVEGSLRAREYEAKDGTTKKVFEVWADDVKFLSRPYRKRTDGDGVTEEQVDLPVAA